MDLENAQKRATHKDVTGRLYGGSRGNSPNASRGHSPANCIYFFFFQKQLLIYNLTHILLATTRKTNNYSRRTTPLQVPSIFFIFLFFS